MVVLEKQMSRRTDIDVYLIRITLAHSYVTMSFCKISIFPIFNYTNFPIICFLHKIHILYSFQSYILTVGRSSVFVSFALDLMIYCLNIAIFEF